ERVVISVVEHQVEPEAVGRRVAPGDALRVAVRDAVARLAPTGLCRAPHDVGAVLCRVGVHDALAPLVALSEGFIARRSVQLRVGDRGCDPYPGHGASTGGVVKASRRAAARSG